MSFETLYIVASRTTPRVTFTQYNSAEDAVQLAFLSMLGVRGVRLLHLLAQNLADIRRANPAFRTYTVSRRASERRFSRPRLARV